MKAVALRTHGLTLELLDIPAPSLERPGQVLIQVLQVGVCGTDRAIAQGEAGELPVGADFLVLGHEMLGRVREVGTAVDGLAPGDLVVATVRRGCGQCQSCLHGESDRCYTGRFQERGILRHHGYMTSLILEESQNLVRLAPDLEPIGVLTEPLSIGEKALEEVRRTQAWLRPRCGHPAHGWDQEEWGECKRALVMGAGPIGMLVAFLLRLHNVDTTVMARQPSDSPKGAMAREAGARYLSSSQVSPADAASRLPELDLIVDATGTPQVPFQVIPHLGLNGLLVLLGVPGGSQNLSVDASALLRGTVLANQVVLGSVNSNIRHFRMAAAHLAQLQQRFPDAMGQVIAHSYPLERFQEAFFSAPRSAVKVVLTPEAE